jgi:hypothetical protein
MKRLFRVIAPIGIALVLVVVFNAAYTPTADAAHVHMNYDSRTRTAGGVTCTADLRHTTNYNPPVTAFGQSVKNNCLSVYNSVYTEWNDGEDEQQPNVSATGSGPALHSWHEMCMGPFNCQGWRELLH